MLPSNGWRPGPGKVGQSGLKVLHLWRHSQKTCTPQAKNFFSSADWKTCRVFWHFNQVRNPNRSGDIPVKSHVRLGVFFPRNRQFFAASVHQFIQFSHLICH